MPELGVAIYWVQVRRHGELMPFGNIDDQGTSLADALNDVLPAECFDDELAPRHRLRRTAVDWPDDLESLDLVYEHGETGISSRISQGKKKFTRTQDGWEDIVLAAHLDLKPDATQGLGGFLQLSRRSGTSLLVNSINPLLKQEYDGAQLALRAYLPMALFNWAIDHGKLQEAIFRRVVPADGASADDVSIEGRAMKEEVRYTPVGPSLPRPWVRHLVDTGDFTVRGQTYEKCSIRFQSRTGKPRTARLDGLGGMTSQALVLDTKLLPINPDDQPEGEVWADAQTVIRDILADLPRDGVAQAPELGDA